MPEQGYTFNERSARRIANVVRRVERTGTDMVGESRKGTRGHFTETVVARLTAVQTNEDGVSLFEWEAVHMTTAGTWRALAGTPKGEAVPEDDPPKLGLAYDVRGLSRVGQRVTLRRWPIRDGDGGSNGTPAWAIVEHPGTLWGKLTAEWTPGSSTVTLQPVKDAGGTAFDEPPDPISAYIIMPVGTAPAYLVGEVNAVFAYEELDTDTYLLKSPQTTPIPERAWEVMQAVGGGAVAEWGIDYMRGHPTEV